MLVSNIYMFHFMDTACVLPVSEKGYVWRRCVCYLLFYAPKPIVDGCGAQYCKHILFNGVMLGNLHTCLTLYGVSVYFNLLA